MECAGSYRYLPDPEGDGKRLYDPGFTPYMRGPQDSLDDPRYRFTIVPGPGRTGKSLGGENHLFKRLRNGPLTDSIIFLPGKTDIDSYADKEFADFFSEKLHPEIFAKLGPSSTDRKRMFKRVDGRAIQLLPANDSTVRQKQAPFIWATEIDGYRAKLRAAMKDLIHVRMRAYGNMAKAYIESHCDAGWNGGIASMWQDSTRGLWYWPCMRCGGWSSPHPLAARGFHMPLIYDRQDDLGQDEMLDLVAQSAGLRCPHCGKVNLEADKRPMLDAGEWIFAGQVIDRDGKVMGDPRESESAGFWIHGAMSPMVSHAELARGYVAALVHFERTRQPERLKEWTVKSLGPVYEGTGAGAAINPQLLRERAQEVARAEGFRAGLIMDEILFVTSAVDVGGSKFDVMIIGWDIEGRWWVIERFTIRQRMVGGRMVDIRPAERIEDWDVLREQVLERVLPLQRDPDQRMPVAAMAIDTGDGHVTWKAREFARRMSRRQFWGAASAPWHKVRLIKGATKKTAPELPVRPREVSKDEHGHAVKPTVLEYDLGVHLLKTQAVERLAVTEDGPGYGRFAEDLPASTFEEFVGEVLVDDDWERRGPNESLDLFGYNEAVRLMLKPDRAEIQWHIAERRPVWARPVPIDATPKTPAATDAAGDATVPTKPASRIDRLAALNRRK